MGIFSSGGGKMKFPKKKNILELRYPEAVDMENQLRDYFKGAIKQPGMGYTPRKTYNPMEMYSASIEDRPRLIAGLTGKPWAGGASGGGAAPAMSKPDPNVGGQDLSGFAGLAGRNIGMEPAQQPTQQPAPAPGFWSGSAFERMTPGTPHMVPDFSVGDPGGQPGGSAPSDTLDSAQSALSDLEAYITNQLAGGSKKQRKALMRLQGAVGGA